MTNRRPTDIIDSLRQTRRSMGDGTLRGRSRVATPTVPGKSLDRVGVVAHDAVDLTDPYGPARGGNTPATVVLYATDVEVPDGGGDPVEWSGSLEGDARANLMPVTLPTATLTLPYAGVWKLRPKWEWTLTNAFRGGGSALLTLDGVTVWPDTSVAETSSAEPTDRYDYRRAAWEVDVYADAAGAEVKFVPSQDSGEAQTLARVEMVATLIEPKGAAHTTLPTGPAVISSDPDIVARDITIWPRDGDPDVLLVAVGTPDGVSGPNVEAYNAETLTLYGEVSIGVGGGDKPYRGIDWTPEAVSIDGYRLLVKARTPTGGTERWWMYENMVSTTEATSSVAFGYSDSGNSGGCRRTDGRVYLTDNDKIYVFDPPHTASGSSSANSYTEYVFATEGMTGCCWFNGTLYVAQEGTDLILRFDGETLNALDSVDVSEFITGPTGVHVESASRWWLSSRTAGVVLLDPGDLV